jgi:ClpP class serine protease
VFAFAGDCIASAAYWIGSQATKLFVGPTSTVGSIGVYTVLVDSSRRASNEGVEVKVIKSGEMKGAGAPGTPITDAQVADTQRVIDDLNAHFVAAVARGRGMRMKHERNADGKPIPADGRVFIGQQAVDMGLADDVMDRSAALAAVSTAAMAVAPGRSVIRAETEMIGDDFVKVVRYSDGTTEMAPAADVAINKKEKKMANNIAKTLGLAEDATEEQIARAIADREQRAAELASKVAALEGTVNNLASQADKILADQLNKRIAEIDRKNKIEALVKGGVLDGKITAKQRASALELATAAPEAFESFLRDFVAVAPVKSIFNPADASDETEVNMSDPDAPDTRAALFQEAKRMAAKEGISQAAAIEKVLAKHDFGASVQ